MIPFDCNRTCPLVNERWCRFRPVLDRLGPVRVDSHTATIKVEYTDLAALKAAVEALGGIWYGHGVHDLGDTRQTGHGFRLPMANGYHKADGKTYWYHPIVLREDGQLAFDAYGGAWGDMSQLDKLKAEYAVSLAEQAARQQGWLTERVGPTLVIHHPSGGTMTVTGTEFQAAGFTGNACHDARIQLGLEALSVQNTQEFAQVEIENKEGV